MQNRIKNLLKKADKLLLSIACISTCCLPVQASAAEATTATAITDTSVSVWTLLPVYGIVLAAVAASYIFRKRSLKKEFSDAE